MAETVDVNCLQCPSMKFKGDHLVCENTRCAANKDLNNQKIKTDKAVTIGKNYTWFYYVGLAIGLIIKVILDIIIGLFHGVSKGKRAWK